MSNEIVEGSFKDIPLNCRFEIIKKRIGSLTKRFILDGAHNAEAFLVLVENLKFFKIDEPVLIFSILSTKKCDEITDIIVNSGVFKRIVVTEIKNPKKENVYRIADMISAKSSSIDVTVIDDLEVAIRYACSFSDNICISGSFYLASDALKIIKSF